MDTSNLPNFSAETSKDGVWWHRIACIRVIPIQEIIPTSIAACRRRSHVGIRWSCSKRIRDCCLLAEPFGHGTDEADGSHGGYSLFKPLYLSTSQEGFRLMSTVGSDACHCSHEDPCTRWSVCLPSTSDVTYCAPRFGWHKRDTCLAAEDSPVRR